jgi:predicted HicB family RNase H-like nuclease
MKSKTIQVKLDNETHRKLKAGAVLAEEILPTFASKVITEALKNKKVFTK